MPELLPVLSEEEIQRKVADLARQISADYKDSKPVLIGVLKGAFVFMADLVRRLTIPVEIDFIRASSYGKGETSSGEVRLCDELSTNLEGKDVLIVEDILDTGLTVEKLLSCLSAYQPKSIRVCVCIDKLERRQSATAPDYVCHTVNSGFLVGYGLDYAEKYRHLPAIYHLQFSQRGEK